MRLLNTIVCLGLIFAVNPAEPATAQAQPNAAIEFLPDADLAAGQWAVSNPDGIAIAIRLGSGTPIAPAAIESTLRNDFESHGVSKLRFFWERGGSRGSSVVFGSRNHVWGPFGLASVRTKVSEAAKQFLFEVERGIN